MNRIDPRTHTVLLFLALYPVFIMAAIGAPIVGIPLLALLVYRTVQRCCNYRSPEEKRRQAADERLRFHLQGSVRGPHLAPRPPKRERLY
jgi:hypothetical protein